MKNSKGNIFPLDPDRMTLTKKDLLEYLDLLIRRWNKNKIANFKVIASALGMKGYIMVTDEETIRTLWNEILNGINELMMINAIARARGENPDWADVCDKLRKKLSGE